MCVCVRIYVYEYFVDINDVSSRYRYKENPTDISKKNAL